MANRKMIIAGAVLGVVAIAALAWAGGRFAPPVLKGPGPATPLMFGTCIPTDTSDAARPVDQPRHVRDRYIYRDGTQVRDTDLSGRPATLEADGSLTYPDGTHVGHNSDTGETTITHPDGRVTHTNIATPVLTEGGEFVWGDGARLPGTDPDGGAGKITPDGSVAFPDGTIVRHDPRTGLTKTMHSDGRVTEVRDAGARPDGDGNLEWNDGTRAPGADPSGGEASGRGDGWIRYPDGTMISHNPASGDTKIIRPDGRLVTHSADTCQTKVIETAGGCLGGPPVIDQCLVGNWRQSGGGPLEWVKDNVPMNGVRMPYADVPPLDLTLKSDGTFQTKNLPMSVGFYDPDDPETTKYDPSTGDAQAQLAPTTGHWSARDGRVRACFDTGGRTTGALTGTTPGHSVTTPFSFGGAAGADGEVSYSCSGTTFKTHQPMPRGSPMTYEFALISKE